jgi:tetratricopeptide (TPR) repeat protein
MTAAMISKMRFVPGLAVAFLLLAIIATGCGDDGQSPGGDAAELVSQGWNLFIAKDFQSALGKFNQAIATARDPETRRNAYDGLGWAFARLGRLEKPETPAVDSAQEAFLFVLETMVKPSRETYTGAAMVALALKKYGTAALNSNWAIERFEEEYEFRFDKSVTNITLRIIRATARFHMGEYESAYADIVVIDDLLNLGLPTLNPTSPDFVAKVMTQLQTVREVTGGGLL